MEVRSLGNRTDLIFQRFEGEVLDRGDYLVLLTPSNPTYRWGNMLLFSDPPEEGDFERWHRLFAREVGAGPSIDHVVFAWDTVNGETGHVRPFLDAGFELDESVVLSASAVNPPPKINPEVRIERLQTQSEWQEALELQVLCRDEEEDESSYRPFMERRMEQYQRMVAAGKGSWFGAYLNEMLVADLGLFVEDGVGRFQNVETHPDYRRQGICGTVVHEVSRYGLEAMGAETLVMIADCNYHAAGIYESVGFVQVERLAGMERDQAPSRK